MTGANSWELLTFSKHMRYEITPIFGRVRVARSLVFYVVLFISLFVNLPFLFWPLCCLPFFDLRLLFICLPFGIFYLFLSFLVENLFMWRWRRIQWIYNQYMSISVMWCSSISTKRLTNRLIDIKITEYSRYLDHIKLKRQYGGIWFVRLFIKISTYTGSIYRCSIVDCRQKHEHFNIKLLHT